MNGARAGKRVLVDLVADPALPGEVLAGRHAQFRTELAEALGLLVEALQPERDPAATRLQEDHAQPRMTFEHAEGDELGARQHLLEGVGHGVEHERVEGTVGPEGGDDHRAALVDGDGHGALLGGLPHRLVGAIRQRAPAARVGPYEGGHEPELVTGPAQLGGRGHGVLHRDHGRAEQPRGVGGAVRGQPVVVGAGDGHRGVGIVERPEVQPDRREQHGLVDALGVHVDQPRRRVGPSRVGVVEAEERLGVREARARRGQRAQRHGQDLLAVHHDVLVAVRVARDDGPVRLGDRRPGASGLHHVPVGVHDQLAWGVHDPSRGRGSLRRRAPVVGGRHGVTEQSGRVARPPSSATRGRAGAPGSSRGRSGCRATWSRRGDSRSRP